MPSEFLDEYLPESIKAFPWTSSPRFSTNITANGAGAEHRNKNWNFPIRIFKAPEGIRCPEDISDLHDHWLNTFGPFKTFPLRDPVDFASRRLVKPNLEPTVGRTDQVLGIGDGTTRFFYLSKGYTRGSSTVYRKITLPVVESLLFAIDTFLPDDPGLSGGPYDIVAERETGKVTITPAPQAGQVITWGGFFDNEVRFEADDSFDRIVQAFEVDGYADLTLWEVRPCGVASDSDGG